MHDASSRWIVIKRSMACNKMLTLSANRKTPLKNAPNNWDRCQPKDRLSGDPGRSEIYPEKVRYVTYREERGANLQGNKCHYEPDQIAQLTKNMSDPRSRDQAR